MRLAVGIDFGTTNSCVATMQGRQPRVVPAADSGQNITPSMVGFLEGKEKVVGVAAKRQAVANPAHTISSVKRFLGRTMSEVSEEQATIPYQIRAGKNDAVRIVIDSEEYAPEQVSALILAKIKTDVEEFGGEEVSDVVITVPAYFNDAQRQAVKDSAAIAGLNVIRLINEPTAAALAYGYDGQMESGRVMVFDLGGGTFDVSVLEIGDGVFEVLATSGDNHLGGDDFDKAIVDWMTAEFNAQSGIDLASDPLALQRLYEAAEKAKIELSSAPQTEIHLPFLCADVSGPHHLQMTLTRAQMNKLMRPLLERLVLPIERCLAAAALEPAQVDDVILVGGMTRMPAVQDKVKSLLGREPHRGVNPDEAVALGAAIQASIIMGDIEDVVLLDVTPLSLGVELADGAADRLVPANTAIPTKTTRLFTTHTDGQTSVEVRVVQGERELARDNRLIGRVQLEEIPVAPRGDPDIEVTFELDVDGLLTVHAVDLQSGHEQRVHIESATALSKEEIAGMQAEARRYADSDRQARQLAEIRNEVEGLREQVDALLASDLDIPEAAAQALEGALSSLEHALASSASPEELAAFRDDVMQAVRDVRAQLGSDTDVVA
jgi:molecular chaperone DnaK